MDGRGEAEERAGARPRPIRLLAAGSLKAALGEAARAYETRSGARVEAVFGPSGLLRARIERGEAADVFASADMAHPAGLAARGGWDEPRPFARNALCVLAAPAFGQLAADELLDAMLRDDVRLGTSTPGADPSGDYAWACFARAEAVRPGSGAALARKALRLTGGPDSPAPPEGRNAYAWLMAEGRADMFLTYVTNAIAARRQEPALALLALPGLLAVAACYGLTVRRDAGAGARSLADFILGDAGARVLAGHGFGRP